MTEEEEEVFKRRTIRRNKEKKVLEENKDQEEVIRQVSEIQGQIRPKSRRGITSIPGISMNN